MISSIYGLCSSSKTACAVLSMVNVDDVGTSYTKLSVVPAPLGVCANLQVILTAMFCEHSQL